ncbi:MAG: GH15, partial [uncultured Gemmatimonadaceae bacterium]
ALRPHRVLRRDRRPADHRARRPRRVDRLPLPAVLRLAERVRRAARRRARWAVLDRAAARRGAAQAALPPRHQRAAHPLPRARGGGGDLRLHAGARGAAPVAHRAAGEERAGPHHLPAALRPALRLRPRPPRRDPRGRRRAVPRGRRRARGAGGAAPHDAGRARARRRRRGGGVHPGRGRVGGVRAGAGGGRRRAGARDRRAPRGGAGVQGHGELLARLDRRLHLHGPLARRRAPLGARPQAAALARHRRPGGGAHLRAPRGGGRRAQLGLPLHVDPRRVVHPVRAHPPGAHGGDARLHPLAHPPRRPARRPRRAADDVRARRHPHPARDRARAPRGVPGVAPRARGQRRARPA